MATEPPQDEKEKLSWRPIFIVREDGPERITSSAVPDAPDQRDGSIYLPTDRILLAIDIALATGRPLLLRGAPGTGKSSLAPWIARNRNWRYYEHVVTARTTAQDLLWRFDAVRQLADAQRLGKGAADMFTCDYIEPGPLWWVFDRESAFRRGAQPEEEARLASRATEPSANVNERRNKDGAVVLLDEIDKADPGVPNDLLVPLASLEFEITDIQRTIRRRGTEEHHDPGERSGRTLFVITTNEERSLPQAFLRRCVMLTLPHPDAKRLKRIGISHLRHAGETVSEKKERLLSAVADRVVGLRTDPAAGIKPPSTAEFLDAVRACLALNIVVDDKNDTWKAIENAVLKKRPEPEDVTS